MVIAASYTDKGGNNIKALTGNAVATLHSNTFGFKGTEKIKGFGTYRGGGTTVLIFPAGDGSFALDSIDLTGVKAINVNSRWRDEAKNIGFEVRLDAPDGKLLGKGSVAPKKGQQMAAIAIPVEPVTDGQLHAVYFVYSSQEKIKGGVASVQFSGK